MSTAPMNAGRILARARWGPARRYNVADLDPVRRERIEAFVEAERRAQQRGAKMTAEDVSETSSQAVENGQASNVRSD